MKNIITYSLILDNGKIIKLEYPEDEEDHIQESIDDAIRCEDFWYPENECGSCRATCMGIVMTKINMKRVIGGA